MMRIDSILKMILPEKWRITLREHLVAISVTHVSGPKHLCLSQTESVVTCVVRNGEFYIEAFIRHYCKMGFSHIVFLDNGSSDRTVELAQQFDRVSICRSILPIQANQRLFKRYLAKRFGHGGWCLDADVDELFEFPGSENIGLKQFLEYLNSQGYTAVVTQLIDMFSSKPLSSANVPGTARLQDEYPFYDMSNVTHELYKDAEITRKVAGKNVIANHKTELLWGGIRETLWGNKCLLTKHSLFFHEKGIELFSHVHFHNNAKLADVSCAMLHYKLAGNIYATADQNRIGFSGNGKGYSDCMEFVKNNPNYQVSRSSAVKYSGASDLVKDGFLFMSMEYAGHLKKHAAAPMEAGR